MSLGKINEIVRAGHGPVLVHDLADDARGIESGQTHQVNGGFRMSGAYQNAALLRAQRKEMSGGDQIGGFGVRIDQDLDGPGPVSRRNTGGNTAGRINRDRPTGITFLMLAA